MRRQLEVAGLPATVVMRGIPGAKTKRIYKSLFLAETDEFSLFAVAGARPTYCLVLAGVNDFCSRMKPSFYVHHINLISDFLQSYGVMPHEKSAPKEGVEMEAIPHWKSAPKRSLVQG